MSAELFVYAALNFLAFYACNSLCAVEVNAELKMFRQTHVTVVGSLHPYFAGHCPFWEVHVTQTSFRELDSVSENFNNYIRSANFVCVS